MVEVDLDLVDRATEVGVVDPIRAAVAEIVDVVDADANFTGAAGAVSVGAADAIFVGAAGAVSAGAADAISAGSAGAGVADSGDAAARSAVVVDLSIPRLSMQQYMEPKVMCIPLSRSAYTERWAGGWRTYSKEPKRIDSLAADTPIFIADGAGATMILALV